MNIPSLMSEIARCLPEGGDWCGLDKAHTLASLVVALRPRVVCEIGVWMGGSLIPMALALRELRDLPLSQGGGGAIGRTAVAIDPWAAAESVAGQDDADVSWWRSVDHDAAMSAFVARLERHGLVDLCQVVRSPSDLAPVPPSIDLLHVDGNHADQARRDVERFAPSVVPGGILVLDDLAWAGGHVLRARDLARDLGFCELYPLGTGVVMQRSA